MVRSILVALSMVGLVACSSSEAPSASASASGSAAPASAAGLKVGDAAPALTLDLHDGSAVDLATLKGKYVLVYFYPKDDTPGCTIEAQGIATSWDKFKAAGVEVYGVSVQDAESHKAFIDKYDLPFPLVTNGDAVAKAFGVPLMKNGMTERQSFLIGKDGKIIAVWPKVDPNTHADAVLAAAKS